MPDRIPVTNPIMGVHLRFEIRPERGRYFPMMVAEAEDGSFVDACLFIGGKKTFPEALAVIEHAKLVLSNASEGTDDEEPI